MLSNNKKPAAYYFDVIEGRRKMEKQEISDSDGEALEDRVLCTAFEKLEEIGCVDTVLFLTSFLDELINEYSLKKILAIYALGQIDQGQNAQKINRYMESKNCDMASAALGSMCMMYDRKVLDSALDVSFENYMISVVSERKKANEDLIECAVSLKRRGVVIINSLLYDLKETDPVLVEDIIGLV